MARALADTPPPLTESAVQDWLDRITYFEQTGRRSEISQLQLNKGLGGDEAELAAWFAALAGTPG